MQFSEIKRTLLQFSESTIIRNTNVTKSTVTTLMFSTLLFVQNSPHLVKIWWTVQTLTPVTDKWMGVVTTWGFLLLGKERIKSGSFPGQGTS